MKKKGRSPSEEKRLRIMDTAAQLFISEGYEKSSMAAIAVAADVSKQTIYSHFGNKEQLFSAAIECKCEEYNVSLQLGDNDNPTRKNIEEFCIRFSELIVSAEAVGLYKVCVAEATSSRVTELFWQAGPGKIRQDLTAYLEQQTALGHLRIENFDFASSHLLSMLDGEAHTRIILGLPHEQALKQLPHYAKSCADVFMAAYGN